MPRIAQWVWALSLVVVVTGSLLPATSAPVRVAGRIAGDKILPCGAYAWLALWFPLGTMRMKSVLRMALATVLLGVAIEFLQRLVPGRAFEFGDMAANAAGVVAGTFAGLLAVRAVQARNAS